MKRCPNCNAPVDDPTWACAACGHVPQTEAGFIVFAPQLAAHNESYSEAFFKELADLETGHFWFEARNRLVAWMARRHFPQARNILEIGCGTGFVLSSLHQTFPQAQLYASDLLVEGLKFASARVPGADLFQMDARSIPFENAFDVIGAFDVIEHIDEDEVVLRQMFDALKPGGGIMLSVPQHPFLWSVVDDLSYHKRRYTRAELIQKVTAAGFEVVKVTSFVSLLLPVMLLNRRKKNDPEAELDLFAEFKLSPLLNKFLATIMRLEMQLIRWGISFPLGGSLLVVARRP